MSDLISRLSELRCQYNCFDENERDAYHTLSEAIKALSDVPDTISRQAAIDALWKALFEYEEKTEKQFQESEDLDVGDWIVHRGFVQNMSDIDRQTILKLPSAQPERKKGKWIIDRGLYKCSSCNQLWAEWWAISKPIERMRKEMPYCPMCASYNGEGGIENDTRMLRFMQETDVQLH